MVFHARQDALKGSIHQQDQHSADWLTAFATPYPASRDSLHGKACHTIPTGQGGGEATKGGASFPSPARAVVWFY